MLLVLGSRVGTHTRVSVLFTWASTIMRVSASQDNNVQEVQKGTHLPQTGQQ